MQRSTWCKGRARRTCLHSNDRTSSTRSFSRSCEGNASGMSASQMDTRVLCRGYTTWHSPRELHGSPRGSSVQAQRCTPLSLLSSASWLEQGAKGAKPDQKLGAPGARAFLDHLELEVPVVSIRPSISCWASIKSRPFLHRFHQCSGSVRRTRLLAARIAYGWSPRLLTPPILGTSTSLRTVGDP